METICNATSITLNKNSVPGDKSALVPGGIRLGTPAMTSRGFVEQDFVTTVGFIDRAVAIAKEVQAKTKKLKDFTQTVQQDDGIVQKCKELKQEVNEFAKKYPMPGFQDH